MEVGEECGGGEGGGGAGECVAGTFVSGEGWMVGVEADEIWAGDSVWRI